MGRLRAAVNEIKSRSNWRPGDSEPHRPFDERRPVFTATLRPTGTARLVRVFRYHPKNDSNIDSKIKGGWLMLREDYLRISGRPDAARYFKELFALKEPPTHVVEFVAKDPVRMVVGIANKHPDLGRGGALQFKLPPGAKREWFGAPKKIGELR